MNDNNKLNQVPLANLNNNELNKVMELEKKLDGKYYLIAFNKNENNIK